MCQELMQGAEDRWANVMCGAFEHNTFTAGQQKLEEHELFTLNCDDDNDCGRELVEISACDRELKLHIHICGIHLIFYH